MIYLSKGILQKESTKHLLRIAYCGQEYELVGDRADLWQKGRFKFSSVRTELEKEAIKDLIQFGIVESEPEDTDTSRYWILTRCICCPVEFSKRNHLSLKEKTILTWLRKAGLSLTVAELIYLLEHQILPKAEFLGWENRQRLIESIYTQDTIADRLLEQLMEAASCRDEVVEILIQLLRKKKIVIL